MYVGNWPFMLFPSCANGAAWPVRPADHALHLDRALPEIGRVLTPGGVLAALWNMIDDRVGWVAELASISKIEITLSIWREITDTAAEQSVLLTGGRWFGPAETQEFANDQVRSSDSLIAAVGTFSRVLLMDEPARATALARIRGFLDNQPETSAGMSTCHK